MAAASVAQVHRAVLRADASALAVKVQRPDIVDKVQVVPSLRLVSLEGAVHAFCDAVEEQIRAGSPHEAAS